MFLAGMTELRQPLLEVIAEPRNAGKIENGVPVVNAPRLGAMKHVFSGAMVSTAGGAFRLADSVAAWQLSTYRAL